LRANIEVVSPHPRGGLGSRVALRTFLLFCLCSTAPVVLFAVLGYRLVSTELNDLASSQLDAASKRYGVVLYERLMEVDALTEQVARNSLLKREPVVPTAFLAERATVISVDEDLLQQQLQPLPASPPDTNELIVTRRLEVARAGSDAAIHLHVEVTGYGKRVHVVSEPRREFLWNDDVPEMPDAALCVFADGGIQIHCEGREEAGRRLSGAWTLYLRPRYGSGEWIIRSSQSAEAAVPTLGTFGSTLMSVSALAIAIALLLSAIQIRRSHRPLALLAHAARRMSRGHFDKPVKISSGDEYAGLARVLNSMAASLRRQFRVLATFARIDQLILAHASIDPVIENVLPRLPRLIRCDCAALILWNASMSLGRLYSVHQDSASRVELERTTAPENAIEAFLSRSGSEWITAAQLAECEPLGTLARRARTWHSAAIEVGGAVRGALLLGYESDTAQRRNTERMASELAHRLAVALGNEDRERALLKQAYYDSLTGLPNRQLFKDRLEQELARARRSGSNAALLFVDLDRFKNINDSLGHSAGDELLKVAAARLGGQVREADTLARLGGDEFTLICPDLPAHAVGALANRILESLRAPVEIRGTTCVFSASIGIAIHPQDGADAETLLRNADTAMYRAKSSERGTAVYFKDSMNQHALRRLKLEQRLRQALDADELTLFFQPKIRSWDGALAGVEALARWTDPVHGSISPAEFIAVAEESGLIAQLDRWAIRSACRTMQGWRARKIRIGSVAVNISLRHLHDQSLVDFVARSLQEHDLPAECLELEITESTLAQDANEIARLLGQFNAMGVRVAIDDFGTGYASMSLLQKMPVDVLKIDRSFVSRCADDERAAALLRALVGVAHALGKEIVAEGVETTAQADFLREQGCQLLQGFLYSPAVPAEELEHRYRSGMKYVRASESQAVEA
jgi:diguanylate cyclase (GGDEF)-like protein